MNRESQLEPDPTPDPGRSAVPEPEPVADEAGEEPSLSFPQELHRLLRGRYVWAILLAVLGLAAGAGLGWGLAPDPLYRSTGIVRVMPVLPKVLYSNEFNQKLPMYDSYLQAQMTLIRSQRTRDLALQESAWQEVGGDSTDAASRNFKNNLEVSRPRRGEEIFLRFYDETPEVAAAGAKAITNAFVQVYQERDTRGGSGRLQILERRRTTLRNERDSLHSRIRAVAGQYGVDTLRSIHSASLGRLNQLKSNRQQVVLRIESLESPASAAPAGDEARPPEDSATGQSPGPGQEGDSRESRLQRLAFHDSKLSRLMARRDELKNTLDRRRGTLGPEHRSMKQLSHTLSQVRDQIQQRRRTLEQLGITAEGPPGQMNTASLQELRQRRKRLDEAIVQAQAKVKDYDQKLFRIDRLKGQISDVRKQMNQTGDRLESLNVEASAPTDRLEVITHGSRPLEPVRDHRLQMAGLGGLAGLVLGPGLVLLIGYFDPRLNTAYDAQRVIRSARLLGVVPLVPPRRNDPAKAAVGAHAVDHIRTMLQIGIVRRQRRSVAITSTGPGDGKTSMTLALGHSFAEAGLRTLIIDADFGSAALSMRAHAIIRRKIGNVLKRQGLIHSDQLEQALAQAKATSRPIGQVLIEREHLTQAQLDQALAEQEESGIGLLDVLDGRPLNSSIMKLVRHLYVLPVGDAAPEKARRMEPRRLKAILEEAREHFEAILIDTGPITASLEAATAASVADSTVLMVNRGASRKLVDQAVARLRSLGAYPGGFVFNRAEEHDCSAHHSSYRSYGERRSGSVHGMRHGSSAGDSMADANGHAAYGPLASAVLDDASSASNGDASAPHSDEAHAANGRSTSRGGS